MYYNVLVPKYCHKGKFHRNQRISLFCPIFGCLMAQCSFLVFFIIKAIQPDKLMSCAWFILDIRLLVDKIFRRTSSLLLGFKLNTVVSYVSEQKMWRRSYHSYVVGTQTQTCPLKMGRKSPNQTSKLCLVGQNPLIYFSVINVSITVDAIALYSDEWGEISIKRLTVRTCTSMIML